MPQTVLVANEKGGVGKTTLLTNLSAYRQSVTGSQDILIIDTDIQGSASDWVYQRTETGLEGIESIQLFGKKVSQELKSKRRRYSDIFIDAGGRDSQELRYGMASADVMLVPIRASRYDLESVEKIEELLENAKAFNESLICYVVVNALKPNPRMPEFDEAMEELREFKHITPINFPIMDRVIYSRSASYGLGVHEMKDKDQKAINEIQKLHNLIYG